MRFQPLFPLLQCQFSGKISSSTILIFFKLNQILKRTKIRTIELPITFIEINSEYKAESPQISVDIEIPVPNEDLSSSIFFSVAICIIVIFIYFVAQNHLNKQQIVNKTIPNESLQFREVSKQEESPQETRVFTANKARKRFGPSVKNNEKNL